MWLYFVCFVWAFLLLFVCLFLVCFLFHFFWSILYPFLATISFADYFLVFFLLPAFSAFFLRQCSRFDLAGFRLSFDLGRIRSGSVKCEINNHNNKN